MINKQTEAKYEKDGSMMTRHRNHPKKWWSNGFLTNRKEKENMNLKKYLPLIGCWVVLALLLGWFVFVSNDLMSAKQAVEHQCEQVKPDLQRWHYLTDHQLFFR